MGVHGTYTVYSFVTTSVQSSLRTWYNSDIFSTENTRIMGTQTDEEKLARIAANMNRKNKLEDRRIKEKVRQANEEVQRLVSRFLEIDPAIETIVLFGSLAEGKVFSLHFDIDLAVRSDEYLKLVGCGLKSSFPVDVVDLDHVADPIRTSIEKYGNILYEKKED